MKKIILFLCILFSFGLANHTFATDKTFKVSVSTDIEFLTCYNAESQGFMTGKYTRNDSCTPGQGKCSLICEVPGSFKGVLIIMAGFLDYFVYVTILIGVLFLVYSGILWSMAGVNGALKDQAKSRIIKTILGLIVLFMSGWILYFIAPWVYTI